MCIRDSYNSVVTAIDNLSPKLMTSEGTSLGKGIRAAVSSFPEQSSEASCIVLFTDCEETDSSLQSALSESVRYGIPVIIVGFGNERESEVLAGDGQTKIKTALRSSEMEKIIQSIRKRNTSVGSNSLASECEYIDASEMGSATKILKLISGDAKGNGISYEIQAVDRLSLIHI